MRTICTAVDAENTMAESQRDHAQLGDGQATAGQSRLPVGAGAPVNTEAPRSTGEPSVFAIERRGVNALANAH